MLNHGALKLFIATLLMVSFTSCKKPESPPPPTEQSSARLISEVTEVSLAMLKTNPPQLSITAKGNVSSAAWTKPQLKPFVYIAPPQDGIYDFNFEAVPPQGPAAAVMSPVETTYTLNPMPDTLKGVRIHATQNKKEAML
ncbi:MAG: hypothetical protein OEW08_14540 [Gammaproteobacteria bacterium]|nr:hypothetical protein [Gammaproteobacteria bacterium]